MDSSAGKRKDEAEGDLLWDTKRNTELYCGLCALSLKVLKASAWPVQNKPDVLENLDDHFVVLLGIQ
ncbi:hypothetical protein MUK42_19457 [Musa troglodytarum]|uniref:Uncharacterized protein n=1 Tax=Musa troglodytarum TaxID=320322 RepID=A0A9E7JT45_9LILI|nr:hypothetical protein MUK42_19457 [Musa troglodytarum]